MLPEALSKFIDELLEGKDPTISSILREHPVDREEFAAIVRSAALTYGALAAIEIPDGAEVQSRERAIQFMKENGLAEAGRADAQEVPEGLIERIRGMLQEKFRK